MHGSALCHVNIALCKKKTSPPPPKPSFFWVVKNVPSALNGSQAGINLLIEQPDKFKSKPLPELCPYSKYKVNEFKVV